MNNNFLTNDVLISELMNLVSGVAEQVPEHSVGVLAEGRGSASNPVLRLAKLHCGSNLVNLLLKPMIRTDPYSFYQQIFELFSWEIIVF